MNHVSIQKIRTTAVDY